MSDLEYNLINQALRAILICALPLIFFIATAGTIAGALQSAMGIREPALNFCVKVVALIILAYLFLPLAVENVTAVFKLAYQ